MKKLPISSFLLLSALLSMMATPALGHGSGGGRDAKHGSKDQSMRKSMHKSMHESPQGAMAVSASYLDAVESGDLDQAGELFARKSQIFEGGSVEGPWSAYKEHHLQPELDAITSFTIERGDAEEETSADGSMAFVAWPIRYRVALTDERVIERSGTVTFVLVREKKRLKIRHVHWSSRAPRAKKEKKE